MQTELIATCAQTGEILACHLEGRVASLKKLEQQLASPPGLLTLPLEIDHAASLAYALRQHVDAIRTLQLLLEKQTQRADLYEKAVADGMALVALIRSCSLAELTNFWHRQRAKP